MEPIALSVIRHTRRFDDMVSFYEESLGMTRVGGWDRPGNRGALLSPGQNTGAMVVEILELGELAVPGAPANVEFSIEVEDVLAWHERLEEAGVWISRGVEDTGWGHRSFGIDDPDGLRIWFYQDMNLQEVG